MGPLNQIGFAELKPNVVGIEKNTGFGEDQDNASKPLVAIFPLPA